ncbi:MAG: galactose-1-phosphate uridylyltransferase [Mesotoga sp.]|uniref:galactose-1-phosphate uridylyltransferase n=1 Tax=unclassified Mesotoga TaxID=1184398 RepID=UPI000EF2835E|nr:MULTISPECIES: galactose-1-phosphate uridylyltransferase [unclassified Mesotoga]MDI9367142.1 galactose-1-phosphate uridylyltransferase [Thermotogota bacterium]NLT44926.1 galactose-1-phosphate uridylyltransferase [Thermotogaceae bacterium]MDD2334213.1 galactose-1-phosphate uridylyltransferase [Mesotoga sp.]MDD3681321.1 galactose-1-phosphate uridylyltransferase [Mesotoga sp.]MDD4207063.1 galactose-1-phosphate uridylyltransferase [Mesotoga sp.]
MPELRKDPIIKRWVIIATERARRPHDFINAKEKVESAFCPFDYGNEHTTPPEVMAFRPADTTKDSPGWWVRVVQNKFPALDSSVEPERFGHGMYDVIKGFGTHEVIIETPDHNASMATLSYEQIKEVIWAYKERHQVLEKDTRIKYILIFKNHGREAGASLVHSHSQLIATPIVPKRVAEEIAGSADYYRFRERCVYCDMVNQEGLEGTRVVEENSDFVAFEPFAARFPFETWILPKVHSCNFGEISASQIDSFSVILKNTLLRIHKALDNPPYNFMLHTGIKGIEQSDHYHWHLEIVPRLTRVAGFEWGSGFYINPMPPEHAAMYLREVSIEEE